MVTTYSKPANFSLSGFIRLTRFGNLLIIGFAQYFSALCLVDSGLWESSKLLILTVSTIFIAAAGYIINDYYDIKIDLINKPDKVVVGKVLKRRIAMVAHTVLSVVGIALALFLSFKIVAIHILSVGLLWAYSNQLKRMPLVGNLIVALLTGLSIYIIAIYFDAGNRLVMGYALFACFFTLIREIIKDMEDVKGDAEFGCKTLPIVLGLRRTKWVIYILSAGFLAGLVFILKNQIVLSIFLTTFSLAIPLGFLFFKLHHADTKANYHYLSNYCKFVMLLGITSMIIFL